MPVLVTGATGNAGRAVLDALLARGLPARAAVRNPRGRFPDGVDAARFDFGEPETWAAALDGAKGVFLVLPPGLGRLD